MSFCLSECCGNAMLVGNSHAQKEQDVYLLHSGTVASIKLTRFKIATSTLTTFAGDFFTKEIERQWCYNVVQIEVSFVSVLCLSFCGLRSSVAAATFCAE